MLRTYLKIFNTKQINTILKAYASTEVNEKWHLFSSVCLERKPIVTPQLNEIEAEFQKYLTQVELERGCKTDFELRHENDKKQQALLKNAESTDLDLAAIQTAQDFEDACTEELTKFQFATRETDADKQNDQKSLERKLDRHLVLLTQQKIGNKQYFLPPQGLRQDGETLRQTAERVLKEFIGSELKIQMFGNSPMGFYKYRYPKEVQNEGIVGAKVFIYFARYLKGQINPKAQFKWLDRSELSREMPEDYHKCFAKLLIDEPNVNKYIRNATDSIVI